MSREDSFTPASAGFLFTVMTAHPQRLYKDPLDVLIGKQSHKDATGCNGCIHQDYLWDAWICRLHKGRVGRDMFQCAEYQEETTALQKANGLFGG
jgi:hypothetical protein